MKKNDKLIVVLGVVILILAGFGIYYWVEEESLQGSFDDITEIVGVTGDLKMMPDSISVSDDDPFYPLIATPLAVNYDKECEQNIIPLYIENKEDPSTAIKKARSQLLILGKSELVIDGSNDAKETSLNLAEHYWESSDAVLLIEYNQKGYELGVIATPIASYLRIPVIITDEMDQRVTEVLTKLKVRNTIVCGENLEGVGDVLRYDSVEKIVNDTATLLFNKFSKSDSDYEIDYLTITNPVDAWPPKEIDSVEFTLEPKTVGSASLNKITTAVKSVLTGYKANWEFTIPEDYKYAVVRFVGINHEVDGVEKYGDEVNFNIASDSETAPTTMVITGATGTAGNPVRDASGKIIEDRLVQESVLYDQGGVTCTVTGFGSWAVKKQGTISGKVTVKKLDGPLYPLMKGLSGVAPYLTAYHKGLVFGKPEFAFVADDDVIGKDGKTCPGFYVPRRNAKLVPLNNRHMIDNVHDPINNLLAELADIELEDDRDIETLRNHYKDNPMYIALVGGGTVLPNFIYQNHVEPAGDLDGDGTDDTKYWVGAGTPSDVIYGNIDPPRQGDYWANQANDIYSEYPFMENIVGRITGWDAQDASALVVRNIFYDDIVEQLEEWRDNYALLIGGGQDFQRPPVRQTIAKVLGQLSFPDDPIKLHTGYGEQCMLRTRDEVAEPLGFEVHSALFEEGMREGFSDEALNDIKTATLFNKLFFNDKQVKKLAGEGNVKGGELMEKSNFIFANGHGCQNFYGMGGDDLTAAGLGMPIIQGKFIQFLVKQTLVPIFGGFTGPGADLGHLGDYGTRDVSGMDFGPSFMFLESCICGKVDGVYPKASSAQAHLHAGLASMIAASTGSNIGGGYLEPKLIGWDIAPIPYIKYIITKNTDWRQGQYDEAHFGFKVYGDLCEDLRENDVPIGLAFRNARNNYFNDGEAEWEVWWTPPLISTGNAIQDLNMDNNDELHKSMAAKGLDPRMDAKYVTYQEYLLFGDPALNLYEPVNEG